MSDRALHVLVAPASMKGALDAPAVAAAVTRGLEARAARLEVPLEVRALPIADGGEGTIDAIAAHLPEASIDEVAVADWSRRFTAGRILWRAPGVAVVESADVVGLKDIAEGRLDPMAASSEGVGALIRAAVERGAKEVEVALGGTCTVDCGLGLLVELGALTLDGSGERLLGGAKDLLALVDLDVEPARAMLAGAKLTGLVDVRSPLLGPGGAGLYMEQKGLDDAGTAAVLAAMEGLAASSSERRSLADRPGAGAAGGMGFALALLGAELHSGAQSVLDAVSMDAHLAWADVVLTAEGRVDAQTTEGKAVSALVARSSGAGRPVVVLTGERQGHAFDDDKVVVLAVASGPRARARLMSEAERDVEAAAFELGPLLFSLPRGN